MPKSIPGHWSKNTRPFDRHRVANNVQCTTQGTWHMYLHIEHVHIKSLILFVKVVVRIFASHIYDTSNKKWRQMKPREDKRLVKLVFCPSKIALWTYIKKIQYIHFSVHGHSSWSTFDFTPSWGTKHFKKPNHGSWTIKSDHGRRPSSIHGPPSWSMIVNRPWWYCDCFDRARCIPKRICTTHMHQCKYLCNSLNLNPTPRSLKPSGSFHSNKHVGCYLVTFI